MNKTLTLATFMTLVLVAGAQAKAGSFPMSSCSGWNGTLKSVEGRNSTSAVMRGTVTRGDLTEYCERDPGGETVNSSGKLTMAQCVSKYMREEGNVALVTEANCDTGILTFRYGNNKPTIVKFPLSEDEGTSCATGMPPLITQFQMLCPVNARRWWVRH